MTRITVQQARPAIEAAAPRLSHVVDPMSPIRLSNGLILDVTHLWTPDGTDLAEYYTTNDGAFAGGNVGMTGGTQFPFNDLSAFVAGLMLVGGHR